MIHQESHHSPQPVLPSLQELGPYELQGLLGRGGMGAVFLGRHRETGERVAVKTVLSPTACMLASLRREVRALSRVHHPGIVHITDHHLSGPLPWYAMELLEGETLRQRIDRHWGACSRSNQEERYELAPLPTSCTLLEQVSSLCAPLAWLHGCGLVHRDLKPSNIFIRKGGAVVLGDFGVAAEFGGAHGREVLQVDAGRSGTPLYMAPEQIRGDLVDARADLYALGCILYECVTGVPPFVGGSRKSLLRRHLHEQPTSPSELLGQPLPERLEWLILTLLQKQPEERLGYAEDVARVLEELGLHSPGRAAELPRPRPYLYRPLFTGREEAVASIRSRLDELALGRGGRIFIGGASGAGKTRLAMEMARAALARQLTVVTGECIPLGLSGTRVNADMRAAPLHPFRPLLAEVADRCRHWGEEETARLLGPHGKVLLPYEPALESLPGVCEQPSPPPLASEQAALDRIFSSLREVLFALAEEDPLLLILDDLQWADEMTLGFLRQLRHEELVEHRVLLLGTYRVEERDSALRKVVAAPGALHLELGRLDEQSIRSMACGMLALRSLPADFDRLVRQSEGNPFFVAEYLRAAMAEELLHRDDSGRWRLEQTSKLSLDSLPLPGSLVELIHRRLSRLDTRARALLQQAAVLGREFEADLLMADPEALETLQVGQILEEAAWGRLRFVHDKLRELAYAAIPPERARRLHRRAAEALERRYTQTPDQALICPNLAYHWARGQVHDKASHYFGLAADRARAAHANGEAIAFYRAAIAEARAHVGPQEPEQSRLMLRHFHESLGDLLALAGRMAEARTAYGEALARLQPTPQRLRARLHRKVGKAWEAEHRHEEALRAFEETEATLGPAPAQGEGGPEALAWWQEWFELQVSRSCVYYWLGRVEEMDALVEEVRGAVEARGMPRQRARFLMLLVLMLLRRERYQVSTELLEYGRRAVETSKACEEAEQVLALFCHTLALVLHGDLEEALRQGQAGLRLAERLGELTLQSRLLAYLTLAHRRLGEVERTSEYARRSLEVATATGMGDGLGVAHANRAWVAWQEQRVEEAEQEALAALECWRTLGSYCYPLQWQALWVLLAVALRREALAEAMEWARALLAPTQQRVDAPLAAHLEAALQAWEQGQQELAGSSLGQAVECARERQYL